MIEVRYAHLADYASIDQSGKLILVGLFDTIYTPSEGAEVIAVSFTLAALITCSLADGLDHDIAIQFLDAEEGVVGNEIPVGRLTFQPAGPGRPYASLVLARFPALQIRGVDDYHFVIVVDGVRMGRVPLYVQLAPEGQTPPDDA